MFLVSPVKKATGPVHVKNNDKTPNALADTKAWIYL